MLSDLRHCALALVFARRKDWQRVEAVCTAALEENPGSSAQIYLLVKLSSAIYALEGPARAFEVLSRALALAPQMQLFERQAEEYVVRRFRLKGQRSPRVRCARVGGVDFCVQADNSGKRLIVGLVADKTLVKRNLSVPILIAGLRVGSAPLKPIGNSPESALAGYFEITLARKLLRGMGETGAIGIELDGEPLELPRKIFGPLWPSPVKEGASQETTILEAKDGKVLNKRGVLVVPRNRDEEWMRETFSIYMLAQRWFAEHLNYELFLAGGTLLGFARDRDVIAFDSDFDSSYVSKHEKPEELRAEFKSIIVALLKEGHDIRLLSTSSKVRRDYFMWHGEGGRHIDIFPASLSGGRYRRPTFVDVPLARDDLFPMKVERMRGMDVIVPRDFEKKVAAVYGASWQRPDPHWKKVRTPEVIEFRHKIMLSDEDIHEIAQYSKTERTQLLTMIQSRNCPTQY